MKDEILKSFVNDFADQNAINELDESKVFERFANYCVISKQYPREFNYECLSVGGGADTALDGVAIIVNGNIVEEHEEVAFFLKNNGSLSVSFSFIQSKLSPKFNGAQILNFLAGIKNFFSDVSAIPESDDIKALREIKDAIYKNSINLEKAPSLDLFFVSTGSWEEPEHINGLVKSELKILTERGLFSKIDFQCVDAERLKEIYRETRNKIVKEIEFPSLVSLPEISGVRQSFVGNLSSKEYLKLITDSDGKLQKNLFYDNVRDYQGNTSVNREIDRTLKSGGGQAAIAIFNNGITVIAKKVERISSKIKLTDYQIVNGCQTSHVLFENRQILQDGSHIVLKIIETTDPDIAVSVIKATNRQTEVKVEAFESLSPSHKDLEEYYKAQAANRKFPIYYERRSKQYDGIPGVKNCQVISLSAQIKAYVSACLAQPQSTHRYFGEILDSNRGKMFLETDRHEKYYLASAILNRIEMLSKRGFIDRKMKQFKYHLVYLLYMYYVQVFAKHGKPVFDEIYRAIDLEPDFKGVVSAAITSVEQSLKRLKITKPDATRSKVVTDLLSKELSLQVQNQKK
ncbi:AIPR family protein [Undibacterium sp. CY18W]|uniref:AIPR family protein n=1 Tax=Undibacterium hunanense TaxID=2762292 RepID=A0ABR6ZUS2_9BURK|nr:AIPR family protein [Undibacterium hunanense]MBC3919636.1 AIPR family protein [Undibacterium hunanense]